MSKATDNITMTYSSLLSKDGKKAICVRFERETIAGTDYAEATLPDHTIQRKQGFSEEELAQLEFYLKVNKDEILKNAKQITGLAHWFQ